MVGVLTDEKRINASRRGGRSPTKTMVVGKEDGRCARSLKVPLRAQRIGFERSVHGATTTRCDVITSSFGVSRMASRTGVAEEGFVLLFQRGSHSVGIPTGPF